MDLAGCRCLVAWHDAGRSPDTAPSCLGGFRTKGTGTAPDTAGSIPRVSPSLFAPGSSTPMDSCGHCGAHAAELDSAPGSDSCESESAVREMALCRACGRTRAGTGGCDGGPQIVQPSANPFHRGQTAGISARTGVEAGDA